jgi:8-amino-7-oxononanoate synthase
MTNEIPMAGFPSTEDKMPLSFDHSGIQSELEELAKAGLYRRLRTICSPQGSRIRLHDRDIINFSSNDYLGLSNSEELRNAMIVGVQRYGVGSGASRLVCGNHAAHEELEQGIAQFKGTDAALAFSSGYATAMGVIPALCGKDDIIILDKLSHASLIDASRLSGATLRIFPHNHLEKLERLLESAREKQGASSRVLVVTESIFSMDGDAAPLREIVQLTEQYGALLLVDEAHGVGVMGPQGRGLIAELGLEKRVALQMGTLSKALGVSGGYIAGSQDLIELLINKARSLIYSTAPPPAVAYAASEAVKLVASEKGDALRGQLRANLATLQHLIKSPRPSPAAIIPLIIGDERSAMDASATLQERGYLIPAIRFPTVSKGTARLRLTLSAAHETSQIEGLVTNLFDVMPQLSRALEESGQEGTA